MSDDVFTIEEAAAFLKFHSVRSFNDKRRELGITAVRLGSRRLFAREQLEDMRRKMFGLSR